MMSLCQLIHSPSDLIFLEGSALTGDNIEDTFLQCASSILSKIETCEFFSEHSSTVNIPLEGRSLFGVQHILLSLNNKEFNHDNNPLRDTFTDRTMSATKDIWF